MTVKHYRLDNHHGAVPAPSAGPRGDARPLPRRGNDVLTDAQCLLLEDLQRKTDEGRNELGPWDERFITDLLDRFRQYGDRTRISPPQWRQIDRIWQALAGGDSHDR
jgi:hypothetical protein